ncbi:MAG: hypothetical protein MI975_05605 [Cytophagales bacterium]|nr:hypothetical protein [Cytophagales bacterium]
MESTIANVLKKASKIDLAHFLHRTAVNDISIDIFKESMHEYAGKLNKASKGNYDLDDYDAHVISVALGQFSDFQKNPEKAG